MEKENVDPMETMNIFYDFVKEENTALEELQGCFNSQYEYVQETEDACKDSEMKLEFKYVNTAEKVLLHMRSHKGKCGLCNGTEIVKAYPCSLCDYATVRKRDLQRHINMVHYFKPTECKTYKCNLCEFKSTKSELKRHWEEIHNRIWKHKCHLCDYSTDKNRLLISHLKETHSDFKGFNCEFCDYLSDTKSHLKYHVQKEHLKSKLFICNLCCYGSVKKTILKEHIECVHLKAKNYHCSFCDYSCTNRKSLHVHIKYAHQKLDSCICHICGLMFTRKGNLNFHIKSIHSQCMEKKFKCDRCAYSTWKNSDLTRHMRLIHLKLEQQ